MSMFPILVIASITLGITGGYIACALSGGGITPADYIAGVTNDFDGLTVRVALVKAIVFGFIVTSICAYQGFYTSGGALEVGQASTRGVVYSCVMVLFADLVITRIML